MQVLPGGGTVGEIVNGKKVRKIVHQADWGTEGVLISGITQLLKELLSDVKIAHGLLYHLPTTRVCTLSEPSIGTKPVRYTTQPIMSEVPCSFVTVV